MTDEPKAGSAPVEKAGEVDFEAADRWANSAHPGIDKGDWELARAYLAQKQEITNLHAEFEALEPFWKLVEQNDALRARLAEVSEAAKKVADEWPDICADGRWRLGAAIDALDAIRIKGDTK